MRRILMIGPDTPQRAKRIAALQAERMTVAVAQNTDSLGGAELAVVVFDGLGLGERDFDARLEEIKTPAPLLVIHEPPRHGEAPLRERRPALLERGVADTMRTLDALDDFVKRVRILLLRSAAPRVLIVEDEPEIASWAVQELIRGGYEAEAVGTLAEARVAFTSGPVDVLVVDRQLPDGEGLDLVRELRAKGMRVPMLVYTALREGAQWTDGRAAGANDYVGKPIDADELRARVHFVLQPHEPVRRFGPLEVYLNEPRVLWCGKPLVLSEKGRGGRVEYALLAYLAERPGMPIPIRMLLQDLWNQPYADPGANPAHTAKRRLTQRLATLGIPEIILTEEGCYKFDPGPLLALDLPSTTVE